MRNSGRQARKMVALTNERLLALKTSRNSNVVPVGRLSTIAFLSLMVLACQI